MPDVRRRHAPRGVRLLRRHVHLTVRGGPVLLDSLPGRRPPRTNSAVSEQLPLQGTATRRRHGYMRGRVEHRIKQLRADGRPLDDGRASVLRDLADAVDRERARLAATPDLSAGTLGRLLAETADLLDRWDRAPQPSVDVDVDDLGPPPPPPDLTGDD